MVKNNGKNEPKIEPENAEKMETKFGKSIKYVELDNSGNIKKVLGVCKADDFKKNTPLNPKKEDYFVRATDYYKSLCKGQELKKSTIIYDEDMWSKDIFKELNIRRLNL